MFIYLTSLMHVMYNAKLPMFFFANSALLYYFCSPSIQKNTPNESVLVPPRPASPKVGSGHKPKFGTPPRRSLYSQSDQNSVCK